jgi:predicted nuclease of predicted toxin-antitoxin system
LLGRGTKETTNMQQRKAIAKDESVEGDIVARLRSEGHDVACVPETSAGIRDDEVLARANAEGRVLLMEDKDFGDLVFFYGNRSSDIILLRAHEAGAEAKAGLIAEILETHEDELTKDPPHFVVLRWGRPPRSRPIGNIGTGG